MRPGYCGTLFVYEGMNGKQFQSDLQYGPNVNMVGSSFRLLLKIHVYLKEK